MGHDPTKPNTSDYSISLTTYDNRNNSAIPKYPWGAAPPVVAATATMQLVIDSYEPDQGPAWWARIPFNKTVVIGEGRMSALRRRRRRSLNPQTAAAAAALLPRHAHHGRQVISGSDSTTETLPDGDQDFDDLITLGPIDGDRPWICTWPSTVLEVFIYPEQQSSSTHTAPYQERKRQQKRAREHALTDYNLSQGPTAQTTQAAASTTNTAAVSTASSPSDWLPFDGVPVRPELFGHVVKFKERRVPDLGSALASCRQVEIFNNGQADMPILDDTGRPVVMDIDETDEVEDDDEENESDYRKRGASLPSTPELTDCGCMWWVY